MIHLQHSKGQIGVKVIATYRGDEYDVWPLRQMGDLGHVELRRFHLRRDDQIDRILKGCDVAVNLIAQDRKSLSFTPEQVNVEGATRIAEACQRASIQLIHVSHLAARQQSKSAFLKSKWEGECKIKDIMPSATIVRPAAVFGLEDRLINALDGFYPFGIPVLEQGTAVKYPVYVGDVAEGLKHIILSKGEFSGVTFDLTGFDSCIN